MCNHSDGCSLPIKCGGMCNKHYMREYYRVRRFPNPPAKCLVCQSLPLPSVRPEHQKCCCESCQRKLRYRLGGSCAVAECGRGRGYADGYCAAHHQAFEKYGDPLGRATVQASHCTECGCERIVKRDRKGRFDLCRRCFRRMKWFENPEESRAKMNAQQRRLKRQQPPWADRAAIIAVYRERPRGMDVDHECPIRGKRVSGLHVEYNLRYLPLSDNRSKGAAWDEGWHCPWPRVDIQQAAA